MCAVVGGGHPVKAVFYATRVEALWQYRFSQPVVAGSTGTDTPNPLELNLATFSCGGCHLTVVKLTHHVGSALATLVVDIPFESCLLLGLLVVRVAAAELECYSKPRPR